MKKAILWPLALMYHLALLLTGRPDVSNLADKPKTFVSFLVFYLAVETSILTSQLYQMQSASMLSYGALCATSVALQVLLTCLLLIRQDRSRVFCALIFGLIAFFKLNIYLLWDDYLLISILISCYLLITGVEVAKKYSNGADYTKRGYGL